MTRPKSNHPAASMIAMSFGRVLLCILLPPLAVLDRGCGSVVLVTVLTLFGWVPGIIGAVLLSTRSEPPGRP